MEPLEELFAMEVEYHRRLRCKAPGADATSLHTSYALQSGYEPLLHGIGPVSPRDIERLADRFILTGDARDVLSARDSLARLLSVGADRAITCGGVRGGGGTPGMDPGRG